MRFLSALEIIKTEEVYEDPGSYKILKISTNLSYNEIVEKYISEEKRKTITLTNLLKSYFPNGKKIDLLSIDVEEHDFEVLSSLDFQLFPVQLIVIEMKNFKMSEPHPIQNFLMEKNYEMIYYARLNGYFKIKIFGKN